MGYTSTNSWILSIFTLLCLFTTFVYGQNFDVADYHASSECSSGHGIPPKRTFQPTIEYIKSTWIFPIILLGLGLIALITFQTYLCCGCLVSCCCPKSFSCCFNKKSSMETDYHERKKFHQKAIYIFFGALLFALIANCLVFLSRDGFTSSVNTAGDSMSALAAIFTSIVDTAKAIVASMGTLLGYIQDTNSNCHKAFTSLTVADEMVTSITTAQDGITSITGIVDNIPHTILDLRKIMLEQTQPRIILFFWCYWAIVMVLIFFFFLAYYCRFKMYLTLMVILVELLIAVLIVIQLVEMNVVKVGGDICINPSQSIVTAVTALKFGGTAESMASYYTTCQGSNPITSSYEKALTYMKKFNQTFNDNYGYAEAVIIFAYGGDTLCLNNMRSVTNSIFTSVYDLFAGFQCPAIYNVYDLAVQKSLCQQAYGGLFKLWIIMLLTCAMLFIALIASSFFYQLFYPSLKHMDNGDDTMNNSHINDGDDEMKNDDQFSETYGDDNNQDLSKLNHHINSYDNSNNSSSNNNHTYEDVYRGPMATAMVVEPTPSQEDILSNYRKFSSEKQQQQQQHQQHHMSRVYVNDSNDNHHQNVATNNYYHDYDNDVERYSNNA